MRWLPGLRFDPSATGTPAARNGAACAGFESRRNHAASGSSTAVVPARAIASTPAAPVRSRWSALEQPITAASAAPAVLVSWSACRCAARPARTPASSAVRHSSVVNAPLSQNASQPCASPCLAASVVSSVETTFTHACRSISGGTVCRPSSVGTTSQLAPWPACRMRRRRRSSCSIDAPYPLFTSTVVTPPRVRRASRCLAPSTRCSSEAARVDCTVEMIPPPVCAISE